VRFVCLSFLVPEDDYSFLTSLSFAFILHNVTVAEGV
jgi:hypothetical protein